MASDEEVFDRGIDVDKNFATTCSVSLDADDFDDEALIDVRGRDFAYVTPDSLRELADAIEETEPADDGDVLEFTENPNDGIGKAVAVHEDDIVAIKPTIERYGTLAVHFTREHPETDGVGVRVGNDETRPEEAECSWTFDDVEVVD